MMRRLSACALLFLLAACGGGGPSPYGGSKGPVAVKLGKPYTVLGQYYEPKYDPNYREEGIASWYGPGFHGRMTASGEEFDTKEMTCAHRTLPMPSLLRVENLDNGRTAVVRVNDRGPFAKNRIIDLSSAAADKLGVKATGTARVRVTYLEEETNQFLADLGIPKPEWMRPGAPPQSLERQYATLESVSAESSAAPVMSVEVTSEELPPPAAAAPIPTLEKSEKPVIMTPAVAEMPQVEFGYKPISPQPAEGSFSVQTASFTSRSNAETQLSKLASIGAAFIREITVNGQQYFRVLLGPVTTSAEAQQMLERARTLGFTDARILVN